MYYETQKLQIRVGPILFPQLSVIYNFIFLLIHLKIRIFESLKRSPFIFLADLIVSQHFFALKFKLNCLKKKCFLQWSVFILLNKFGSISIYNSTLISFEEKKMYLETIPFSVLTVPVLSAQFFALDNPCLEKFRLCSTSCRVSYMTGSLNCQFCVCDDPKYSSNSSLFLILYFMEFTFYAICF